MAEDILEGDAVYILEREVTPEDVKSGLYYNFLRGLTGSVQKIYDNGDVALTIHQSSLTEPVVKRHLDVQEAMKAKWLDGLSEEAKGRLSDQERDFKLHYAALVSITDIRKMTGAEIEAMEAAPKRITQEQLDANEAAELERRNQ